VSAVVEDASVNRLRLRHDLYQKLTAKQQEKFVQIVQQSLAGELN
jgi:Spy/CpxP family protein refolding chaperone